MPEEFRIDIVRPTMKNLREVSVDRSLAIRSTLPETVKCEICKTRPGTIEDIPQPMADRKRLLCVLCKDRIAARRMLIEFDE